MKSPEPGVTATTGAGEAVIDTATPMMKQWNAVKAAHPDAIVFFRMGDFFEMFHDDAVLVSRLLELTLTARGPKDGPSPAIPMAGVPHHAAAGYVARLVKMGYKVAMCDQVEDPRKAKGIVRREVTRIATPGTTSDPQVVGAKENVFLAAVVRRDDRLGFGFVDLSTGRLDVTECAIDDAATFLADELPRYRPREILLTDGGGVRELLPSDHGAAVTVRPSALASPERAAARLRQHLGVSSLIGFGLEGRATAVATAGLLFAYLEETQMASLSHLRTLAYLDTGDYLTLDATTVRNLEIVRSMYDGSTHATLLAVADRTATAMGARLLRDRLLRPSRRLDVVTGRLAAVAALRANGEVRSRLRSALATIHDLERLLSRVTLRTATPRDLLALRDSLGALPVLKEQATSFAKGALTDITDRIRDLAETRELITRAVADDAPATTRDGGIIQKGFSPRLDELRSVATDGRSWIAAYEASERKATGIASLKVRFNKVFGYAIEVTRSNLGAVPQRYERRQTLANAERYTTPELKEREAKVLEAEETLVDLEAELFAEVREAVAQDAAAIAATAGAVAELDVAAALAEVAAELNWCEPEVVVEGALSIEGGRHPVVEAGLEGERFVSNDLLLDPDDRQVLLVTGPNMGGKSTYLRQAALAVVLAQAGSFVPARRARIPLMERVFTRVGASDDLARGRSTFMVEMTETANILHNATSRSLVILDEVGRGTATFDGLSLAWAIVEYLHAHPRGRPLVLFATHYHELTDLAHMLPRVKNLHVAVRAHQGKIVFLRRIEEGPSDRSYGIEVAKLAGLPHLVIDRARDVLRDLEAVELGLEERLRKGGDRPAQLTLFVPSSHPVIDDLKRIDPDSLTPLEALNRLSDLARRAKKEL